MTRKQLAVSAAGAALAASVLAGIATATPGAAIVGTIVARAGFADRVDIMFKIRQGHGKGTEVLHVRNAADTVMQRIVIAPGGHTGWHSHPGPVVVLVAAGELTFYSGEDPACAPRTYSAGQAFIDSGQGHVHIARNLSTTEETVLWVTYFDVPPGAGVRIDAPDPGNCSF